MNCFNNFFARFSLLITLFFFIIVNANANDSDVVNCNKSWKIVVLGSSTSFGTGATVYDSSWVGLFTAYVKRRNVLNSVVNLGIPGYTTYQNLRPTGYIPPAGRPSPNSGFNITAALLEHPNAIIINMPSNDAVNNYTIAEQQSNFEAAIRLADSANIPVWVTTTQPRNLLTTSQMSSLTNMRDWIYSRFGNKVVDFWSTVSNSDGTIASTYMYDNVHVNNKGHRLFFSRMAAETILDSLCNRYTSSCTVGAITGPTNACAYTGNSGLTATYSIAATGFSNINWTVPEDANLLSGQGTNTITLKYFSTFLSGTITAVVTTNCGATQTRTFSVTQRSPVISSIINGPINVCQYTGTNQIATYSVAPASGAITYRWTLPSYVSLTSATADSTTINVIFSSAFVTSTNKKIKIQAISGCGNSIVNTLSLNTTVPLAPTLITGPTGVCAYAGTSTGAVYSISKLSGANSYNWQIPTGTSATHPAGTGINDTTINVIYNNTFTSGSIAVAGVSGCGTGALKSIAVAKSVPLTPDSIKAITISSSCPTRRYAYYVPSLPTYASSLKWTVPTTATIDSGQGSTKILVTYNTTASTNQLVRVAGVNSCGQGTKRELIVNMPACILLNGTNNSTSKEISKNEIGSNNNLQILAFQQNDKLLINLTGNNFILPVNLKIYDIEGKLVENISNKKINQVISTSHLLKKGLYIVIANQGIEQKSLKVLFR